MSETGPITREEMVEMFGEYMPIEAVNLVWNSPGDKTIGEVRAELRRYALLRSSAASGVHYTDYEGKAVPVEQGRVMHGTVNEPQTARQFCTVAGKPCNCVEVMECTVTRPQSAPSVQVIFNRLGLDRLGAVRPCS